MSPKIQALLKIGFVLLLVAVFAFYGLQRSKTFLDGPKIAIIFPNDGITVSESFLQIEGEAKNISHIYLSGRQIFTDEQGFFKESLLLARGYNIIEIRVKDKFNREIIERREIVLK